MKWNTLQVGSIGASVVLFLILYFGFSKVSPKQQVLEKSRAVNMTTISVENLLQQAHSKLSDSEAASVLALEQTLSSSSASDKITTLKQLSGKWFELGHPAIAGHYAKLIAEEEKTPEAWGMGGTTFAIAAQRATEDEIRAFCSQQAIQCFESAISLNPNEVSNRINLALVYTDNPPAENPMKGVLMLRELNETTPGNPSVLVALAKLAIKTNQLDKARERLEEANGIQPNQPGIVCLLADVYAGLKEKALSDQFGKNCQALAEQ